MKKKLANLVISWIKTRLWLPIWNALCYGFSHIPKWLYYVLLVLTALGIWDIAGHEIYEVKIKPFLYPPIIAFPEKIEVIRSKRIFKAPFFIKNRSNEIHYSIELRVYIGDLQKNFENLELEILSTPEKKIPIYLSDAVMKDAYLTVSEDKEQKAYIFARIGKLEPGKDKLFLLTFKSIRENQPIESLLGVTIKIANYSKLPGFMEWQENVPLPYKMFGIKKWKLFQFHGKNIIGVLGPWPNVIWLSFKDVCAILAIPKEKVAFDGIDYDNKTIATIKLSNGTDKKEMLITDYAMRQLAKESQNSKANEFQEWVSNNLIPIIKAE